MVSHERGKVSSVMYQVGDKVVYGIHGVCTVTELEEKNIDRKKVQYYVLMPVEQPDARYFIPTGNPAAVSKLSPLLTRQEIETLLCDRSVPENTWINDENQRKQRYRELISSSDRTALLAMVRVLRAHKTEQLSQGRKFHLCDENFLKDAQKLLSSEFSVVLNLSAAEVADYVEKYL